MKTRSELQPRAALPYLINEALTRVRKDPQHHLNLGYREAIYHAFGPHLFDNGHQIGHKRRIALAHLAVSRVLPLRQSAWPKNDTVPRMIRQVEKIMNAPVSAIERDALGEEVEALWEYVTELTDETRNIAGVVGMAAVEMLSLALWDGFTEWDGIDCKRDDSHDFMDNDVHFYAATAYANGPPYAIALSSDSSPDKRQEFWEWWLTEAVPAAWAVTPMTQKLPYYDRTQPLLARHPT